MPLQQQSPDKDKAGARPVGCNGCWYGFTQDPWCTEDILILEAAAWTHEKHLTEAPQDGAMSTFYSRAKLAKLFKAAGKH